MAADSSPEPGLLGSSIPSTKVLHEEVFQHGATQPGQRLQRQALAAEESTDAGERREVEGTTRAG